MVFRDGPRFAAFLFGALMGMIGTLLVTSLVRNESEPTSALTSVVKLEILNQEGEVIGFGTGFVAEPGIIATAYHVIDHGDQLVAIDWAGTRYNAQGLVAAESGQDVALVRFPDCKLPSLTLSESQPTLEVGDAVLIPGHPDGGRANVIPGALLSFEDSGYTAEFKIQASISPGTPTSLETGVPNVSGTSTVSGTRNTVKSKAY